MKLGALQLLRLAEEILLDKSTASRMVDALERKGYVSLVEAPEDRRAVRVQATPAGIELYERIRADLIAEQRAMISNMAPDVRQGALALQSS